MPISMISAGLERIDALRQEWVDVNAAIARLESRKAEILSERFDILLIDAPPGSFHHDAGFRSMAADFAAAAHQSAGAVEGAFCIADTLIHRLPATAQALSEGRISVRHASVIVSASAPLAHCAPSAREGFEQQVLDVAAAETPARTAAHAKAVAAVIAPRELAARHKGARMFREVTLTPVDDGMALLTALVPEVLGRAALDRLTGLARAVKDASRTDAGTPPLPGMNRKETENAHEAVPVDDRALNNIRADILIDLLLAAHPETVTRSAEESVSATVQVTIAASTLIGQDDRFAELDGHGPVLPDTVRLLAGSTGSWNRLFLTPTGMAVATDNYTPTAAMKRFLRARDQRCRFPGCRMPVHRCQIDHNHDHAKGGRTELCNLCHFCTTHHVFKHPDVDERYRWTARQLGGGVIEWTSPEGAVYLDTPPKRVMFV